MLSKNEQKTLEALKSKLISFQQATYLYDVNFRSQDLHGRFLQHALEKTKTKCLESCLIQGEYFPRWLIKDYFSLYRVYPFKYAANIMLGMSEDSLISVLCELDARGTSIFYPYSIPSDLAPGYIVDYNFKNFFPSIRYQSYNGADDYISLIHEAISKELKIKISTIKCKKHKKFPINIDCITHEPICESCGSVFLDLGIPIMYSPDICSNKTYEDNKDILKHNIIG